MRPHQQEGQEEQEEQEWLRSAQSFLLTKNQPPDLQQQRKGEREKEGEDVPIDESQLPWNVRTNGVVYFKEKKSKGRQRGRVAKTGISFLYNDEHRTNYRRNSV